VIKSNSLAPELIDGPFWQRPGSVSPARASPNSLSPPPSPSSSSPSSSPTTGLVVFPPLPHPTQQRQHIIHITNTHHVVGRRTQKVHHIHHIKHRRTLHPDRTARRQQLPAQQAGIYNNWPLPAMLKAPRSTTPHPQFLPILCPCIPPRVF
jgi:hypothetical protein